MKRIIKILTATLLAVLICTTSGLCTGTEGTSAPLTTNAPAVTFTCRVDAVQPVEVTVSVTTAGLVVGEEFEEYLDEIMTRFTSSIALTGDDVSGYTLTLTEFTLGEDEGGLTIKGDVTIKLDSDNTIPNGVAANGDLTISDSGSLTCGELNVDGDMTISGGMLQAGSITAQKIIINGQCRIHKDTNFKPNPVLVGVTEQKPYDDFISYILGGNIPLGYPITFKYSGDSSPFTVSEAFKVYDADGVTDGITYSANIEFYPARWLFGDDKPVTLIFKRP